LKIKYIRSFFALLLVSQLSFAQEMPLDFSDASDNFIAFSGSSFSFNYDPDDAGNKVGQFFNDGASEWQGFTLDLKKSIVLDSQKNLSLSFYGFDPNAHKIVLKLEKGAGADVEVTQNVPAGGGWTKNIAFNFANAKLSSDGVTAVNASGKYDRITIFIDGGTKTAGTYLIDNISDGTKQTNPNALDVEYTFLVWEDNFDKQGAVDADKWHHQTQVIIPGVGWANGEEQHYTKRLDNSFVDNAGQLNIVAKKETLADQGITKNFTSARLNSKFAFTYGRVDVRAKLPIEQGTWPAIWMLGKNINEDGGFWNPSYGNTSWPACGEIDIMEHGIFPGNDINFISSALHTPCCNGGNPNKGGTIAKNLGTDFHIYSVNWSANQITFLLDGVGYYTYNPAVKDASTWPFFKDQYILLNVAMGGIAGNISAGFSKAEMVIDYVKVFQQNPMTVVDEPNEENNIKVYPNPTSNNIYITSKTQLSNLSLFNMYGQLVLSKVDNTDRIDVSGIAAGTYFLSMDVNNKQVMKKIIIK
jgi:beta-glucanase (GH16 family)